VIKGIPASVWVDVYEGQRLKVAEIKLENGEIPVREFIRQLAKSDLPQLVPDSAVYVLKH